MSPKRRIYLYDIEAIPDCTHHSLVALCGGNVKEHIFNAHEHILRMISNFQQNQITFTIRYNFDPNTRSGVQNRLKLQLAVKISDDVSEDTVKQLIDSGPLSEFYQPEFSSISDVYKLPFDFKYVCEIVRREQKVKPLVPRERNPGRIPSIYYSIEPFEAIDDNDYLMVDSVLSRMAFPCTLELTVSPVNQSNDLEALYKYIRQLMSINEYSDDSLNGLGDNIFDSDGLGDNSTVLTLQREKDPMADDIVRDHQEFYQLLRKPQLLFNVKIYAMNSANALMLASAVAEAGLGDGKYNLIRYSGQSDVPLQSDWYSSSIQTSQSINISLDAKVSEVWGDDLPKGYKAMGRLSRMASVDELKGLIRFPVGGHSSPRCIRKITDPKTDGKTKGILLGDDLESQDPGLRSYKQYIPKLSGLFDRKQPPNLELKLPLDIMPKHIFVAGVPGSGKTTAVFNMLIQLYQHNMPFLVIEPAKTEYRLLKTLKKHPDANVRAMSRKLRVYTPGNDQVSPFRFNPFSYPEGITLDGHMGQLSSCFEAAMPMVAPLPALIAEAMEDVYARVDDGDFPTMVDMVTAIENVLEDKAYDGEVKSNIKAMLQVRFGLLTRRAIGKIFECHNSVPSIRDILEYPTVIEMDDLSQGHACLLTLFLLSAVREHVKTDPIRRKRGLHHVTVIEEAHNIVGRSEPARASENNPDPKAFAANYVSRMLAEMRALGECIIIADQLPSAVADEVVKNTGTKLSHRLVSNDDRENLGGSMLLDKQQTEEIARLKPGEAYYYTEGLHLPRRIRCLNANDYLQLNDFIDSNQLISLVENEYWFIDGKIRRLGVRETIMDIFDSAEKASMLFRQKHEGLIDSEICDSELQDDINDLKEMSGIFDRKVKNIEAFAERNPDEFSKYCVKLLEMWRCQIRAGIIELTKTLYNPKETIQQ